MKCRLIAVTLLMLFGFSFVQAQDNAPEYRLRQPSEEEYLNQIAQILGSDAIAKSANSAFQFVNTVTTEWVFGFTHQHVSLKQLVGVFDALAKIDQFWDGRDIFGKQIVQAFIDNEILVLDSQKITTVHYETFDIEATPRDFDGDGQPEWTLYVQNPIFTQRYVVAYKDGDYQLIDVPLPWFGCCYMYYSTQSGFIEEQLFADLTGDGLPEWVLALGGIGGNWMEHGRLYILQWRDGKIIDVSAAGNYADQMMYESPAGAQSLFPYGVDIEYGQPNANGQRNIIVHHMQNDNWGCNWHEQKTFAWQGSVFELIDTQRTYDNVQGCEIRRAEEAMWSLDFAEAVQHYEQGLKLPPTEEYFSGDPTEITRYATARLAIAYKLDGREADALQTINRLTPLETDSPTLAKFIAAIKANLHGDDMRLCEAAYDVFNFECIPNTDSCLGSPLKAVVGQLLENSGDDAGSPRNGFPAPERAGCDVASSLKTQLVSNPFSVGQTPQTQLEKMGYKVLQTIHFDLDDRLDSWLIWLDFPIAPLFFSADKHDVNYKITYPNIPYLLDSDELPDALTYTSNPFLQNKVHYVIKSLPNRSGKVLITTQSNSVTGYYLCPPKQISGGTAQGYAQVIFPIWKFDDNQLKFQQEFPFCENVAVQDTFGSHEEMPLELSAWAYAQDQLDYINPATYKWDESTHQYKLIRVDYVSPAPIDYSLRPYDGIRDADEALQNHEFAKALTIIETSLTSSDISADIQPRMTYIHALALEALNRPDEALTEYVTIYTNVPDSAWGKLAALHLECVANCRQS